MPRPKGLAKTGGRTKGTPNRTTAAVKQMVLEALDTAGGKEWFVQLAQDDPRSFATLVGRLLPREVAAEVRGSGDLVQRILDARDRAQS